MNQIVNQIINMTEVVELEEKAADFCLFVNRQFANGVEYRRAG